jgi:hypothetical protein
MHQSREAHHPARPLHSPQGGHESRGDCDYCQANGEQASIRVRAGSIAATLRKREIRKPIYLPPT